MNTSTASTMVIGPPWHRHEKIMRRTKEKLAEQNVTVKKRFDLLGRVLLAKIGGAMGPFHDSSFIDMGTACGDASAIDKEVFSKMLKAGAGAVQDPGGAKVGDKNRMDALLPALEALTRMTDSAEKGRKAARGPTAKLGRASRLGERSRGTLDAGSVSCSLRLKTFSDILQSTEQDRDDEIWQTSKNSTNSKASGT